jgi:hypothetical protein
MWLCGSCKFLLKGPNMAKKVNNWAKAVPV